MEVTVGDDFLGLCDRESYQHGSYSKWSRCYDSSVILVNIQLWMARAYKLCELEQPF